MEDIFEGILGGLIVAYVLNLFHFGEMLIEVFQPFTVIALTSSTYYCFFGLLGLIIGIIRAIKN